MPLIISQDLPAKSVLDKENIFTMSEKRAMHQDIRPIRVAIVNLMPNKEETELQLLRMLSNTALQVKIDLITTETYKPKNTNANHIAKFYKTFSQIKGNKYDAMIVTGAPVEKLKYEEVLYWDELLQIFDFAKKNVYSTMFICWAAQAALYHYYGVPKIDVAEKIFGVYEYEMLHEGILTKGFDSQYYVPQSRYTKNISQDLAKIKDLVVWADREDTGVQLATTKDYRFIFSSGHWEYDEQNLYREYTRDRNAGLDTKLPQNYFKGDDPENDIMVRWKSHGNLFFSNWINLIVYQDTPYDLEKLTNKRVSKFGGSSLSNASQFAKVKDIVYTSSERNIIIVSAPGRRNNEDNKVTDMLQKFYENKKSAHKIAEAILRLENLKTLNSLKNRDISEEIKSRFLQIVDNLKLSEGLHQEVERVIAEIEDSTSRDFIVSRGEYLNGLILAEYLGFEFADAEDFIIFDDAGNLDKKNTYEAIRRRIDPTKRYVIPGFYGKDTSGNIRTFDRGGSDITGSIVASALNSDLYENWTDVDGVMTKDPRIADDAETIDTLSYNELLKIVDHGAHLYHPDAIRPVMENNIPINIKNTNNPESKGTIISGKGKKQ